MVEKKLKSFFLKRKFWSPQMQEIFHEFKHYEGIEYAFSGDITVDHLYHIHNTPDNVYRLLIKMIPSILEMSKTEDLNILVSNIDSKNKPLKEYMNLLGIKNIQYYNIQDIKYVKNLQRLPFNKLHAGPGCALTLDVLTRYRSLITGTTDYKKIVITRNNNRSIPDDIMMFLLKKGFQPVTLEEMSVQNQINLFAGITHVVGAQGAGFANLVYCNPGVKSLELSAGFDLKLYTNLANHITDTLNFKKRISHLRIDRDEVFADPSYTKKYDKFTRKCKFYNAPIKLSYDRFVSEFNVHFDDLSSNDK